MRSASCLDAVLPRFVPRFPDGSGEQFFHDLAVDVGEAEAAALEFEGQALVIDAQQVHQGGIEVVHMHGIPDPSVGLTEAFGPVRDEGHADSPFVREVLVHSERSVSQVCPAASVGLMRASLLPINVQIIPSGPRRKSHGSFW